MPSNAFSLHLRELLLDAEELDDIHTRLSTGAPGRQYGLASLNRSAVVISVSAWESYVEELMRECLQALFPSGPDLGAWPALNAHVLGLLGRFNTPNARNVSDLINRAIALPDIHASWVWRNCTAAQAVSRLDAVLNQRHQIAHGVNPRPVIHHHYSSDLPVFFRRLAQCTDVAVRRHLVTIHRLPNPWPA